MADFKTLLVKALNNAGFVVDLEEETFAAAWYRIGSDGSMLEQLQDDVVLAQKDLLFPTGVVCRCSRSEFAR